MRQIVTVLVVHFLGGLVESDTGSLTRVAAAQGRMSACALLSRDLVEKFDTGSPQVLKAMKPSEEPIGVAGSSCEDGNIGFQIDPFARPDELRKSPGKDWQPVQGVGETAYFRNKADTYAEVMVWSGGHHFTLQVGVPNGGSVESIRPRVIDLARAVIAKLR
jgi:hypothetical protein